MENGIPIAKSNGCVSPLLNIHGELEYVGNPVVGVEFGVVAVALGDDIHHHCHDFQAEEGAHEWEEFWLQLVPPEEADDEIEDVSDPVEDFPNKGTLVVLPGYLTIEVVEYNANHENQTGWLRMFGEQPSSYVVHEEPQSSEEVRLVVDYVLEVLCLKLRLKH